MKLSEESAKIAKLIDQLNPGLARIRIGARAVRGLDVAHRRLQTLLSRCQLCSFGEDRAKLVDEAERVTKDALAFKGDPDPMWHAYDNVMEYAEKARQLLENDELRADHEFVKMMVASIVRIASALLDPHDPFSQWNADPMTGVRAVNMAGERYDTLLRRVTVDALVENRGPTIIVANSPWNSEDHYAKLSEERRLIGAIRDAQLARDIERIAELEKQLGALQGTL